MQPLEGKGWVPPAYFVVQEFVPPDVFEALGGFASWGMVDQRLVYSVVTLRVELNLQVIINDWHRGGQNKNRGLRTFDSICDLVPKEKRSDKKTMAEWMLTFWNANLGGKYSQHFAGRAADVTILGMDSKAVRKYILDHQDKFPFISYVEADEGQNKVHLDVRNSLFKDIHVFEP